MLDFNEFHFLYLFFVLIFRFLCFLNTVYTERPLLSNVFRNTKKLRKHFLLIPHQIRQNYWNIVQNVWFYLNKERGRK